MFALQRRRRAPRPAQMWSSCDALGGSWLGECVYGARDGDETLGETDCFPGGIVNLSSLWTGPATVLQLLLQLPQHAHSTHMYKVRRMGNCKRSHSSVVLYGPAPTRRRRQPSRTRQLYHTTATTAQAPQVAPHVVSIEKPPITSRLYLPLPKSNIGPAAASRTPPCPALTCL